MCTECSAKFYWLGNLRKACRVVGITVEHYFATLERQAHRCAICQRTIEEVPHKNKRFSLDHCHKTGKFRALLCVTCNTGIGSFQDDPELLRAAIRYLEVHHEADQGSQKGVGQAEA